MNIIIVNESEKKAWLRSRRILGKYLEQTGRRTWLGSISEEGLIDLKLELRATASRHTSIACHRIVTRKRTQLVWIVGNRDAFDDKGRYAFRVTGAKKDSWAKDMPKVTKVLRGVGRIAALLHDLGKSNRAFQRKIKKGGSIAEAVRHDFLSAALFFDVVEGLIKGEQEDLDKEWMEALVNEDVNPFENLADENGRYLKDYQEPLSRFLTAARGNSSENVKTDDLPALSFLNSAVSEVPVCYSILWLLLTHHRLPRHRFSLSSGKHLNKLLPDSYLNPSMKNLGECLQLEQDAHPVWHDKAWLQSFKEQIRSLYRLLYLDEETPDLYHTLFHQADRDNNYWFDLLVHQARPLLIYSDYAASIEKGTPSKTTKKGSKAIKRDSAAYETIKRTPFANSLSQPKRNKDLNHLADPLYLHLKKTKSKLDWFFRFLNRVDDPSSGLETISDDEISPDSAWCRSKVDERYRWQVTAEKRLARGKDLKSLPFFGVILSETGSGKTIGGARIMKAVSQNLRFTLGLGLRSLTLQTGESYEQDLKLRPSQMAVTIGSAMVKKLFDIDVEEKESSEALTGSENLEVDEGQYEMIHTELGDASTLKEIFGGGKGTGMMRSPILVTTIDHIIHTAEMVYGGEGRMMLRVMSSDLILDEIDNYSAHDSLSLAKLVYLHGLYGRSVILMSATLSPVILQGLWENYRRGFKAHCFREAKKYKVRVGLFSNLTKPKIFLDQDNKASNKPDNLKKESEVFLRDFVEKLEKQPPRHRLKMISAVHVAESADWKEAYFQNVFEACLDFSADNFEIDPSTGKSVSFGFVRWNRVKTARDFAKYLYTEAKAPEKTTLRFQCYHAKFLVLELYVIERELKKLLTRKNDKSFWQTSQLRKLLDDTKDEKVIVIVSTTSIQETGRDHDYDWTILEPCSTRSIIQAAGRVVRHRKKVLKEGICNIGLMSHPIQALDGTGEGKVWAYPGIETNHLFKVYNPPKRDNRQLNELIRQSGIRVEFPHEPRYIREAEKAFDMQPWTQSLTSATCLLEPEDYSRQPMTALEYLEYFNALLFDDLDDSETARKPNARNYFKDYTYLSGQHAAKSSFRFSNAQEEVIIVQRDLIDPEVFNESASHPYRLYLGKDKDVMVKGNDFEFFDLEIDDLDDSLEHKSLVKIDKVDELENLKRHLNLEETDRPPQSLVSAKLSKSHSQNLANELLKKKQNLTYHQLLGFDFL